MPKYLQIFIKISWTVFEKNGFPWGQSKFNSAQLKVRNRQISILFWDKIQQYTTQKFCTKVHPCVAKYCIKFWLKIFGFHWVNGPPTGLFDKNMKKIDFKPLKAQNDYCKDDSFIKLAWLPKYKWCSTLWGIFCIQHVLMSS